MRYLAWALEMRFYRGGFDEADAATSVRHARAAVAHGGDDATALAVAALPLLQLGHDFEAASGAIARAIALKAVRATALYFGAHIHAYSGDAATRGGTLPGRCGSARSIDEAPLGAQCARDIGMAKDGSTSRFPIFQAMQANPPSLVGSSALIRRAAAQAARSEGSEGGRRPTLWRSSRLYP